MRIHEKWIKRNNIRSVYKADSLLVGILSFPLGVANKKIKFLLPKFIIRINSAC